MARTFFEAPLPKPDFSKMEKELLEDWSKKGIVKKYLQKNNNSSKNFSFLDGPITANNPMGVHHAWGRTYKDLWQRFNNMRGFKQRFQNGFDCQGLWVEVEVEKELGLRSKKDIESLVPTDKKASIAKFVELCKERANKFAMVQTEQSKRLGYFMDWDNSYFTLSDDNNYMIWLFLKKCHEKGLIYKGHDSVPWCPRCGTAISQHEMLTEDYKEATHESVYIRYPVKGRKNEYLLVWTTTPWTLPGNVAIAIDEEIYYVASEKDGKTYYIGESAAKRLGLKIGNKFKGNELVGLTYDSPFDNLLRVKNSLGKYTHRVVASDPKILPVSEDEGTGLVHVAPGAGTEDFGLGKKLSLPVIELIDEEAVYLNEMGDFSGQNAKKHPELILEYLKSNEEGIYLFSIVSWTHRYPACWRCKTELVWRVVDEWYIAMDPLRAPLKAVTKKISWIPKFGLKRELDWLDNMHDWLISKKRYWGLALPIWECQKCGNFEIMGSKEELREKATQGWKEFEGHTPHRPWIDAVKVSCPKCKSVMERIKDVGNPWLDAGIVSFSTISSDNKSEPLFNKDKKEWEKWFPADFITESFPGQFKNWFYSLLAMSTVFENRPPFKTVLGFATLLGEDGRPIHKSWGNSIEFNEGADKIGVDVMRWIFVRQNPSENLLFGLHVADETRRRFHLKLWNVYNFFVTYANLDGWEPNNNILRGQANSSPLDKWILARMGQTLREVTSRLEDYDAYFASESIEKFIDDLSLWYIRRSRDRVGPASDNAADKTNFYETCHRVLVILTKLLAPFTPFIAEIIYRNLTREESVHLSDWPEDELIEDKKLIDDMQNIRTVVEKVHAIRKEKQIPVRVPLHSLITKAPFEAPATNLYQYLLDELNIKKWEVSKGNDLKNNLDITITPELEEEAKMRELIRQIQEERKKMGMNLTQYVNVKNLWLPKNKLFIQRIKSKAGVRELERGEFSVQRVP